MYYLPLILLFTISLTAAQRVVVAELFTATWCGYCPYAARALVRLKSEVGDSLTIIAYHSSGSDPFYNVDASGRASFYHLGGYPTCWWDGVGSVVGGSPSTYNQYRQWFNGRKRRQPFVEITIVGDYNPQTGEGWATARIKNIMDTTITGMCHFVIVQRDTPYYWQGEDSLHWIERKMLPNYNGTSVTIAPNETKEISQSFSIPSSWLRDKCYLTVFVQSIGTAREILQAAEEDLVNLGVDENKESAVEVGLISTILHDQLVIRSGQSRIEVTIVDGLGRIQKRLNIAGGDAEISLRSLPSGIYFCRIRSGKDYQLTKFIKL
ncbi:hypothetical protein DRP53_05995 [candidate division WOR-3 bacterium]|uniref:Secretion system C-terminal sorting domain-containing protein n=1 Tax=candidate division WOR-3 bacterium TaxID=2052148 RepID=A0A660SJ46_UNCW3|nr:MAG: hypothetical protein DRP53_05995 [candidate division WOR-3 bacterium]